MSNSYNTHQIKFPNHTIGDTNITIIAGPCAIESLENTLVIAKTIKELGAHILRGGAFKARTSPYDFQGLGIKGLEFLHDAAKKYNLLAISEIMDAKQAKIAEDYVDILQIGARNMQNFSLLKAVGKSPKPVLLKRGLAATYQDFLMAAEYILHSGNPNVILCERGIRTFETHTRNTLDLAAIPVLKSLSNLPVFVDPSHGTGRRELVEPMSAAAIAAGANGLMLEVHPEPDLALSDAKQTIDFKTFGRIINKISNLQHEN